MPQRIPFQPEDALASEARERAAGMRRRRAGSCAAARVPGDPKAGAPRRALRSPDDRHVQDLRPQPHLSPENAHAIVPDDAADLPHVTRALYVGGGGDVAVRMMGGGEAVFRNLQAGSLIPIRATRILAAGTTAGDLVGLW